MKRRAAASGPARVLQLLVVAAAACLCICEQRTVLVTDSASLAASLRDSSVNNIAVEGGFLPAPGLCLDLVPYIWKFLKAITDCCRVRRWCHLSLVFRRSLGQVGMQHVPHQSLARAHLWRVCWCAVNAILSSRYCPTYSVGDAGFQGS